MSRPRLEVADIFRRHGAAWRAANEGHLSLGQRRVMTAIEICRTAALGGHVERCEDCAHTRIAYNSCRNRHCPKCQWTAAQAWLEAREAELLPVPYFHVVFTLPAVSWLDQGANVMLFGPPGGGKSHLAAALGMALIQNGRRVLFIRTTDLVQRLQVARRDLELEAAINKLDKYQLLILDDIAYVTKDQAETSVLFELIAARYERRSLLITANQPFGEWGKIFTDKTMTLAAIDRLVHHATIVEMNVESYRRKAALKRKRGD
jgi:hypothetical protein